MDFIAEWTFEGNPKWKE